MDQFTSYPARCASGQHPGGPGTATPVPTKIQSANRAAGIAPMAPWVSPDSPETTAQSLFSCIQGEQWGDPGTKQSLGTLQRGMETPDASQGP